MKIGDIVYLRTDPDQNARMIIKLIIEPTSVQFCLAFGITSTWHYEMEISESKNISMSLGIEDKITN